MGEMKAIAPTAKKLWGQCRPQVARTGILLCRRCTQPKVAYSTKITNVILNVKKVR